jgi:alginate O-acetyltransferase complex protein AlgI
MAFLIGILGSLQFISLQFAAFFIVVAGVYFLLPLRVRWAWLLAASLYFYGAAEPIYLLQILAVTGLSYVAAIQIERAEAPSRKSLILTGSVVLLVANLFLFKYTSFLNETLRSLFGFAGADYPVGVVKILLPIGISFYSFQLISYLVDVARGAKAERHAGVFALYVAFFPKLIAGPIERAKNLLPQLHAPRGFDYALAVSGLQLIAWGAFKKVVVADRSAPFVQRAYEDPHAVDGVVMTFSTWLYAFQLYFDFSGYTDMALGLAAVLGFKLMQNFNRPYFATSIQDFWKRWHISLTSWLTDYIYTPLTRSKRIKMKWHDLMLLSLFITFLVSGLWHGAQWTFVAWGALHGAYMVGGSLLQRPWNKVAKAIGLNKRPQLYRAMKIAVTFVFVCLAYILFRAESLADAAYIFTHLGTGWDKAAYSLRVFTVYWRTDLVIVMAGIAVVMLVEFLQGRVDLGKLLATRPALRWTVYYAGAASIALMGAFYGQQQFIYFRF